MEGYKRVDLNCEIVKDADLEKAVAKKKKKKKKICVLDFLVTEALTPFFTYRRTSYRQCLDVKCLHDRSSFKNNFLFTLRY